jgi:glycosyltransferase involved in cell wall biosynthesis
MTVGSKQVLVVGLNYDPEPTGIAPYTSALSRGLTRAGHKVKIVTTQPHYPAWEIKPDNKIWTETVHLSRMETTRVLHYVPKSPSLLKRLISELTFGFRSVFRRWGSPEVIILPSPSLLATGLALIKARLLHKRAQKLVWVQDLYARGLKETNQGGNFAAKVLFLVEKYVLQGADCLVVIHDGFAKTIQSDYGILEAKIVTIRNWTHIPILDGRTSSTTRRELGWKDEELVVLHSGNMGKKQGLENIVATAKLAAVRGINVRFVLLGDGSEAATLKNMSDGVKTITFMAPVGDLQYAEVLRSSDILLVNELPGLSQMAMPSKLTSYFAAGKPILAACNENGLTASEIRASSAGWIVAPGNPEALLHALIRMSENKSEMIRLGNNGKQYVDSHLREEKAISRFLQLL